MILKRGGGRYRVRVYVGVDPVSGRKSYLDRTVRGHNAAKSLESTWKGEVARGRHSPTSRTLGELLDAWLDHAEHELAAKTVVEYRGYVRRTIRPELGDLELSKVTTHRLDVFYRKLRGRFAARTIRQIHAIIRRACRQGVTWGWLPANPAADASPGKVPHSELDPPDDAAVRAAIRAAGGLELSFGVLVRVAAATGARRGELVGLRWDDLDGATLTIARAVTSTGDVKETKSHAARRVVVDAGTVAALEEHRAERIRQAAVARALPVGYVFSDDLGATPWNPDKVSGLWRRLATGYRFHDLRHWRATSSLAAGIPVRQVAAQLGHRDTATTLRVYAHAVPELDDQAAEAIGVALDG